MEVDLNAQNADRIEQSELIRLFGDLVHTYSDDDNNFPSWIVSFPTLKGRRLAKQNNKLVKKEIKKKYAEVKEEAEGNKSRSILALSFQDTQSLTPQLLSETSDQTRTFLFAGHDTNTSMLQWAIYELSRTPRALKAVRDELDEVLGPDTHPEAVCSILEERGQSLLPRMNYVNAVIKETLRLHPPASYRPHDRARERFHSQGSNMRGIPHGRTRHVPVREYHPTRPKCVW